MIHALNLAGPVPFGESWIVVGTLLTAIGHLSGVMALASHLHGVRVGYRLPKPWLGRLRHLLSLETCVISGLALAGLSVADIEGTIGMRAAVEVPVSRGLPLSSNQGEPMVMGDSRDPALRSLTDLVDMFLPDPSAEPKRSFRLFGKKD